MRLHQNRVFTNRFIKFVFSNIFLFCWPVNTQMVKCEFSISGLYSRFSTCMPIFILEHQVVCLLCKLVNLCRCLLEQEQKLVLIISYHSLCRCQNCHQGHKSISSSTRWMNSKLRQQRLQKQTT